MLKLMLVIKHIIKDNKEYKKTGYKSIIKITY